MPQLETPPTSPLPGATPPRSLSGSLDSSLVAAHSDDIRELSGVEPLPALGDEFPWEEVGIAVGAVLLLALAIYLLRRRRRPRGPESREAAARRRLAALAALDAPDPRTFHAEMAQVLREYIQASLGLDSSRLTSRELLDAFHRNGHMSEDWQYRLEVLLACCDQAKFCREWDQAWDPRELLAECREVFDMLAIAVAVAPRLASPWEGWEARRAS